MPRTRIATRLCSGASPPSVEESLIFPRTFWNCRKSAVELPKISATVTPSDMFPSGSTAKARFGPSKSPSQERETGSLSSTRGPAIYYPRGREAENNSSVNPSPPCGSTAAVPHRHCLPRYLLLFLRLPNHLFTLRRLAIRPRGG